MALRSYFGCLIPVNTSSHAGVFASGRSTCMFPSLHWIGTDPDGEVLSRDDAIFTYIKIYLLGYKRRNNSICSHRIRLIFVNGAMVLPRDIPAWLGHEATDIPSEGENEDKLHWIGTDPDGEVLSRDDAIFTYIKIYLLGCYIYWRQISQLN
jgi:hypothetical protein